MRLELQKGITDYYIYIYNDDGTFEKVSPIVKGEEEEELTYINRVYRTFDTECAEFGYGPNRIHANGNEIIKTVYI